MFDLLPFREDFNLFLVGRFLRGLSSLKKIGSLVVFLEESSRNNNSIGARLPL